MSRSETQRDWFTVEVVALFVTLASGAALRYWLSTAIPFDAAELDRLSEATTRHHGVRALFIMFNGLSLFAVYLFARRSAGVPAAFAVLLLLQTSVTFQEAALRVRAASIALPIVLGALTYWRYTRPPRRAPRPVARACLVVAVLLGVRGITLGITLPGRLAEIRAASVADSRALYASIAACGGGVVTPLERLAGCALAWPAGRSLAQQEALLVHAQQLPEATPLLDAGDALPRGDTPQVAVFDEDGVALFVVARGEMVDTALRVVGAAAQTTTP
jgi:hypothetical protein